jgi:pyruvate dehydrogenase E2 component (dihydrolipoamide acetyltransferase)
MPVEVIMPRVEMDMTQGRIAKWHVRNGEAVRKGQPIFDIETDKAAMEIESPADGTVGDITMPEGASIPVGAAVAFIYARGESPSAAPSIPTPSSPALPGGPIGQQAQRVRHSAATEATVPGGDWDARGKGGDGKADLENRSAPGGIPRATPLARRLARQSRVALEGIVGSGPRGRILAEDIRKTLAGAALPEPQAQETVPLNAMRRKIAERLVHAKQSIPHFYLTITCDMGQLLSFRERLNASAPPGADRSPAWRLSLNDFIIKAWALALQRVPMANVTWNSGSIVRNRASDIAVAVAVDDGLFTPVIRAAESKTLSRISLEMKDLGARARAMKLAPAEYHGGSTTISNLGMHGIEAFSAIINPPHATILAVGAVVEEPAGHNGAIALRPRMKCTLSCDHRAVDGALGAELLASFRGFIEEPALMLA